MALVRALPVWLKGGQEMECDSSEVLYAVSTSVVDDCQLRLVQDSHYATSHKSEVMNITNVCQCIYLLTQDGVRRSLRLPTPLSPVTANGAEAMLRCFSSWQVLSVGFSIFGNLLFPCMTWVQLILFCCCLMFFYCFCNSSCFICLNWGSVMGKTE